MSKLSDVDKIKVVELYNSGQTFEQLSRIFNVSPGSIKSILINRNIQLRPRGYSYRKYTFNENYFDVIDTEEKAYWLGFLMGDGSVKKENRTVTLEIGIIDINHLQKFKTALDATYNIRETCKNCSIIGVTSGHFVDSLIKHNVVPNKTKLAKMPNLDEKMMPHFIRGILDSDGWITHRKSYNKTDKTKFRLCWEIGFSSGSEIFIKEIHNWINNKLGKHSGYLIHRVKGVQSVYQLTLGGNKLFKQLYDILYKDATIYLDRKYEKINNAIKYIEETPKKINQFG